MGATWGLGETWSWPRCATASPYVKSERTEEGSGLRLTGEEGDVEEGPPGRAFGREDGLASPGWRGFSGSVTEGPAPQMSW